MCIRDSRDIVSRAIFTEQKKGEQIYLDCRGDLGARMVNDFPTVYELCIKNKINPQPAKNRVFLKNSIPPNNISKRPLIYTNSNL